MEHMSRSALRDHSIAPAQATADIIYLNSAENRYDPADVDPHFRQVQREVLERMMGVLSVQKKEQVFAEAERFVHADRTHLRDSEVLVLAIAFWGQLDGKPIGCSDVLTFSYEHMKKPLSDGTVWKAFADLADLGLLCRSEGEHTTRAGRPRELYQLTSFGAIALNMAISYARHLSDARTRMAA